jgi:hypothetical protein
VKKVIVKVPSPCDTIEVANIDEDKNLFLMAYKTNIGSPTSRIGNISICTLGKEGKYYKWIQLKSYCLSIVSAPHITIEEAVKAANNQGYEVYQFDSLEDIFAFVSIRLYKGATSMKTSFHNISRSGFRRSVKI